jgi:dienelactone hydrolase
MRVRRSVVLVVVLAVGFAAAAASAPIPPPAAVEFAAADGLLLHGSYWAAVEPGPAVLLLHQCNMDRASWAPLAAALAESGVHVLVFDFRGFGQSVTDRTGEFSANRARLWPEFVSDVDRAVAFLGTLPDVDRKRLGVMGASCGGSQTLLLALRDPSVKAIGFLSSSLPFLTDQDLVQFEKNRDLPILGIAAEKDEGTYERTKRLFDSSPNPASKLVLYKGDLHGVPLFAHDPGLVDSIVAWFRARL